LMATKVDILDTYYLHTLFIRGSRHRTPLEYYQVKRIR
jgi:hypothetical protein